MGVRLGRALKSAREAIEPKLTQTALGDRLGRNRLTIHNWESGKSTPSYGDRLLLAASLGVPVTEFNRLADLDKSDGQSDSERAHVRRTTPQYVAAMPQRARVWVQRFLMELVEGGCTEVEVEHARSLLAAPALTGFLQGGAVRAAQLTEDEIVGALEAIGEGAIKRVLRSRGRVV